MLVVAYSKLFEVWSWWFEMIKFTSIYTGQQMSGFLFCGLFQVKRLFCDEIFNGVITQKKVKGYFKWVYLDLFLIK